MNTTEQLAAVEARAAAAFPGPWKAWDRGIGYEVHTHHDEPLNYHHRETFGKADAEFIANARTDVPALLALVREQQAALDAVEDLIGYLEACAADDEPMFAKGKVSARAAADQLRAALDTKP